MGEEEGILLLVIEVPEGGCLDIGFALGQYVWLEEKSGIAETYQPGEHEAGYGETGTTGVDYGGTAWDVEASYCGQVE